MLNLTDTTRINYFDTMSDAFAQFVAMILFSHGTNIDRLIRHYRIKGKIYDSKNFPHLISIFHKECYCFERKNFHD